MQKTNDLKWDLSDIYAGIDDPRIAADFEKLEHLCTDFEQAYKGNLNKLSPQDFFIALQKFEEIRILAEHLRIYPHLLRTTNLDKPEIVALLQNTNERLKKALRKKVFFPLEISHLSDEKITELNIGQTKLIYGAFITDIIKYKKYDLSEKEEEILMEMNSIVTPWVDLYEMTRTNTKYAFQEKELLETQMSKYLNVEEREIRHEAGKSLVTENQKNLELYMLIFNTLAKDRQIRYELRGLSRPDSLANINNDVEDAAVDALVQATRVAYKSVSERYFKFKAKMLEIDDFHYWDRTAAYANMKTQKASWEEIKETVRKSFHNFSPEFYGVSQNFFEKNWIDVTPAAGKKSGAFVSFLPKTLHPYISLNFNGMYSYAIIFGHELGHAVHGSLSSAVCEMSHHPSRVMSEMASIFGENLTFQEMMRECTDQKIKFWLLADRIETMIGTSIRQIAFHNFEMKFHTERKQGMVSSQRLGEIWKECMQESFGDSVSMEGTENMWCSIPHLFRTPFYVYSYAFSSCMVNSLFKVYQEGKVSDFEQKFLDVLKAGGEIDYKEALSRFGIDASAPDFWDKGYDVIAELIDELETLAEQIK